MKRYSSTSTCIPVCVSYECNSVNLAKSNFTIRYIPNICLEKAKEEQEIQKQEKQDMQASKLR